MFKLNITRPKRLVATGGLATALAIGALAGPAATLASGVVRSGNCSAGSVYTLQAEHDNGRIQVELEVETNRSGQAWYVRFWDNGVRVYAGRVATQADGTLTVDRSIANRPGVDHIKARATNPATGEVCQATVSV